MSTLRKSIGRTNLMKSPEEGLFYFSVYQKCKILM
nr:MAG TPA: hypothetical protein [Caudoviricetes sp.]